MGRGGRGWHPPVKNTLLLLDGVNVAAQGTQPYGIIVSPDGKNVYAGDYSSGLSQYSRNVDTGVLTALSPLAVVTKSNPRYVAISPDGAHVYAAEVGYNEIALYNRSAVDGSLGTYVQRYTNAAISSPIHMVISPDGAHLYVGSNNKGTVTILTRDSNSGSGTYGQLSVLAAQPTILAGASTNAIDGLAMTSDGKYLYACNQNDNKIYMFVRDASSASGTYGQLSVNTGSGGTGAGSIASGSTYPAQIVISPDGAHLYVACDGGFIGQFAIGADGTLTSLGAGISRNGGPWSIAISTDGAMIYMGCSDMEYIAQFTRDNNSGSGTYGKIAVANPALVRTQPATTGAAQGSKGPYAIAVSPDGKHAYSTETLPSPNIAMYRIHP